MSLVLKHAREHYFKGAYALSLFGDLSAVGGVPVYDAYDVRVPKPDTLLLPFTLSAEQEGNLRSAIPQLKKGLRLEESQNQALRQLIVVSPSLLMKRRHISLSNQEQRLKVTLLTEKEEPLLDTILRETVIGDALTEYWVSKGYFKHRKLEDFEKQLVVEAALEKLEVEEDGEQVTVEDATKQLEKARKLLFQITPKSFSRERKAS